MARIGNGVPVKRLTKLIAILAMVVELLESSVSTSAQIGTNYSWTNFVGHPGGPGSAARFGNAG